jgi:PAS domain-containing protein
MPDHRLRNKPDHGLHNNNGGRMNQPGAGYLDTLQTIIDFLPSGITMFNADQEMVVCNQNFRTMLEFPDSLFAEGLPSLRELALFNAGRGEYGEGDSQVLADQICERARGMQPHVFERQRPNGTILEIRGNPMPNGGWVSIYTDITDRKHAEREAQRYSTYLDTVLNSLPQGVTVVNEKLGVELWNKRFENLLNLPEGMFYAGIPFEEAIRKLAERGEYGDVDPVQKARDMAAMAMKFEPHRLERTRADGGTLEIEGRDMRIDGKVAGFVTTYTDITERIRNEEALRRVKNMMSDAINFSPTFIWEADAEGKYTHLQGVEHILGFTEKSLLGLPRAATLHADSDTRDDVARRMPCTFTSRPIRSTLRRPRHRQALPPRRDLRRARCLRAGETMRFVNDHDPLPLLDQLSATLRRGGRDRLPPARAGQHRDRLRQEAIGRCHGTPAFFDEVRSLVVYDPLAEFLGATGDGRIEYRYADAVRLAGHSCPTVAAAYWMTLKALTASIPMRCPSAAGSASTSAPTAFRASPASSPASSRCSPAPRTTPASRASPGVRPAQADVLPGRHRRGDPLHAPRYRRRGRCPRRPAECSLRAGTPAN